MIVSLSMKTTIAMCLHSPCALTACAWLVLCCICIRTVWRLLPPQHSRTLFFSHSSRCCCFSLLGCCWLKGLLMQKPNVYVSVCHMNWWMASNECISFNCRCHVRCCVTLAMLHVAYVWWMSQNMLRSWNLENEFHWFLFTLMYAFFLSKLPVAKELASKICFECWKNSIIPQINWKCDERIINLFINFEYSNYVNEIFENCRWFFLACTVPSIVLFFVVVTTQATMDSHKKLPHLPLTPHFLNTCVALCETVHRKKSASKRDGKSVNMAYTKIRRVVVGWFWLQCKRIKVIRCMHEAEGKWTRACEYVFFWSLTQCFAFYFPHSSLLLSSYPDG